MHLQQHTLLSLRPQPALPLLILVAAHSRQALFRPVSMCVPDLNLICEIMLMAEGFQQSKILSRKFVILYKLCEDLLSKSRHYDWKLRAIKTTLYVAGSMKRAAPELSEDKVDAAPAADCALQCRLPDFHAIKQMD